MRSAARVLVSIGAGLLAVVLLVRWASARESQLLHLAEMREVVVASRDIAANTVLDEQVVQHKRVPAAYVQPRAAVSLDDVRHRVTIVPIAAGAQIQQTSLRAAEHTALAYDVPRGRRAVTIAVSDVSGVAGLIRPANFVDVFGSFEFGRPTGYVSGQLQYADEKTETRLLLQNLQVIAVARDHEPDAAEPLAPPTQTNGKATPPPPEAPDRGYANVTLLVTPPEAQRLVLAQELGSLTLSLRSPLDAGQVADLGSLDELGLLNVKIPLKRRPRPAWREIRGQGGFGGY